MSVHWPIVLVGQLEKGQIRFSKRTLDEQLKGRKDCVVEIVIERKHATRSLAQNRLYWGVYVKVLSDHTGYDPEEIHEILKAKFLPKKLTLVDEHGVITDEFTVGGSTSQLNKLEFGEYLERIQRWAAETLSVVIPDPPRDGDSIDDRFGRRAS